MMESNEQLKGKTVANMIWRLAERTGAQGVAFIVSIVLARFLSPEAYGTVALLTVFTTILNVFVDSGLGNALIQKINADDLDFSTVFIFNMAMCLILYAGLFTASPLIAKFYGDPSLTSLMRVLGLTLVISGMKNIQQAYVSRNLLFKKFFYATLGGTIIAAIVGIWMAYKGFGAWAIVMQHVVNTAIDTTLLYITVRWRPHLKFSFERFRGLFSFGWKLLASSLLDTVYNNVRQLIIGKVYSSSDLAYFNQGDKFPKVIIGNINNAIDSVLLPVMSTVQDDRSRMKSMTRRSIKTSTYIMAPIMMGLAFTAKPLVCLLLTEKWLGCVPYLQIFCVSYMFYPIHTANLNAMKAMGRSDLFLKLEIVKKIIASFTIVIALLFGPMAMAYSMLVTSFISQVINSSPNKKIMDYGYLEQLKDILPGILLAVFVGICTLGARLLGQGNLITLVLQVIIGVVVYIGCSAMLKLESFVFLFDMVKKKASR